MTVRNPSSEWLLNRRFASAEQSAQDAATATVDDVDRAHTTRANGEAHGLAALNLKDETILAQLALSPGRYRWKRALPLRKPSPIP